MFWIPNISTITIAWVVQSLIFYILIISKNVDWLKNNQNHWMIKAVRSSCYIAFAGISLVFIDTNMKLLIFLNLGYGYLVLHLASIVLTFILAIEILLFTTFLKPTIKKLITFFIMLISFLILFEFYLNMTDLNHINILGSKYSIMVFSMTFPILIGFITSFILTLLNFLYIKYFKQTDLINKPFWNKEQAMKRYFNLKFLFLNWILISLELILNLQGLSLFLWLTLFI